MILVIAPHHSTENQKDGMIQRIAHIDSLINSIPRTYLNISVRRFFSKKVIIEGLVTIYHLNLFIHFLQISRLIKKSNLIYIHSAYNALKACLFHTKAHIVFDAHGIVPEELIQEKKILPAILFSFAERRILHRCDTLVCVSRNMLLHFTTKYSNHVNRNEIILPILPRLEDSSEVNKALKAARTANSVIYAGGTQSWQNVDKMLDAARTQSGMNYTFLSGDLQSFKRKLSRAGLSKVTCLSVTPEAVKEFYVTHEYGFILRDDLLVNQVACPTKLVEYLYWGVLPIVVTPRIGDFDADSLHSISLEDFRRGVLPCQKTRESMREHNQRTLVAILDSAKINQDLLQSLLRQFSRVDDLAHIYHNHE